MKLGSSAAAPFEPTIMKTLTPQYNPKATRAVYMYGPFKLPAADV
jgi:hypothetical protein